MAASATLMLSGIFSLAAGILYFVVGYVSAHRRVGGESSLALHAFSIWWYSLGATAIVGGFTTMAGAFGYVDVPLLMTLTFALLAVICLALWGLLYYLVYLFFGARSIAWPLAGMYVAYYAFLVFVIVSAGPVGIQTERWAVRFVYLHDFSGEPFIQLLLGLLVLPQMIGAVAYFTLLFRTDEPMQRYRIALISTAIFVWFGSSLFASSMGISSGDGWHILSRLIGLAATLTVLAAYAPPAFIRHRLASKSPSKAAISG